MRLFSVYPWNDPVWDLHTYGATRFGLHYADAQPGPAGAFLYAPAFAQLIVPLTLLPYPVFAAIWTMLGAALLVWLAGRYAIVLALLPPVAVTLVQGQLDLAFAAVAVVGLRWPAAWALPLLTKVTPGVGLVWFLVRGEWRSLGVALAATGGVIAVSAALAHERWFEWLGLLSRMEFPMLGGDLIFLPLALWVRLPLAVAIVAWGARTDRTWTIPVAMCLAMPIVWLNSPTVLVAIVPMLAAGASTPAGRWLRGTETAPSAELRPAV